VAAGSAEASRWPPQEASSIARARPMDGRQGMGGREQEVLIGMRSIGSWSGAALAGDGLTTLSYTAR
jgi:hypothetical protein